MLVNLLKELIIDRDHVNDPTEVDITDVIAKKDPTVNLQVQIRPIHLIHHPIHHLVHPVKNQTHPCVK